MKTIKILNTAQNSHQILQKNLYTTQKFTTTMPAEKSIPRKING
jgi:hypothetical protein